MEHDIGCKIKAARIEKKLTQEQVAELLGVSRQTISNWENDDSTFTANCFLQAWGLIQSKLFRMLRSITPVKLP